MWHRDVDDIHIAREEFLMVRGEQFHGGNGAKPIAHFVHLVLPRLTFQSFFFQLDIICQCFYWSAVDKILVVKFFIRFGHVSKFYQQFQNSVIGMIKTFHTCYKILKQKRVIFLYLFMKQCECILYGFIDLRIGRFLCFKVFEFFLKKLNGLLRVLF